MADDRHCFACLGDSKKDKITIVKKHTHNETKPIYKRPKIVLLPVH